MLSPRAVRILKTCALGATLFSSGAHAAITLGTGVSASTQDEINSGLENAYVADVSNSDLLNGITPTDDGRWFTTSGRSPAKMTDGIHGANSETASLAQSQSPPAVLVFDLGTGANGLGYDLSSIVSIASWRDSGFHNQNWTLEVAGVGDDGSLTSTDFTLLASADYRGFTGGGSTKITIDGLSGTLTSGVQYLRLTALVSGGNNNRTAWRELDITGTATAIPEPSMGMLGGLGMLMLLRRRRR